MVIIGQKLGLHIAMCSVYDILDNFSLVTNWEDTSHASIQGLTFHNNQNSELVVVFRDSSVGLMSLSVDCKDITQESEESLQQTGTLEIKQELRLLEKYSDMSNLLYAVENHGLETWVSVYDSTIRRTITLCSITREGFRKLRIESLGIIEPARIYTSASSNSLVLVSVHGMEVKPFATRILKGIDFANDDIGVSPIEIKGGQSFGFSECGMYFLMWTHGEDGTNAIEVYDVHKLCASPIPLARTFLGSDVLQARGYFLRRDLNMTKPLASACQDVVPYVVYLVASSSKVKLTICTICLDEILKEVELTLKEVITMSNIKHSPHLRVRR